MNYEIMVTMKSLESRVSIESNLSTHSILSKNTLLCITKKWTIATYEALRMYFAVRIC